MNLTWHDESVTRDARNKLLGFRNKVVWFTGLSGSGKSTIAHALAARLHKEGKLAYVLDGDNVRHGLNKDLSFSPSDREENIRRVAEVAKLLYEAGAMVLVSFISPYRKERRFARELVGKDFVEVFVDCPVEECERRDPKGLYKKARAGEISDLTGVGAPYEAPEQPEVRLDTAKEDLDACVQRMLERVTET